MTARVSSFGPFRLIPEQRALLENGRRVHVGSRALDVLIALVERPGELVTKQELMQRVWPDTVVEEGNLRVHVASLRRALADGQAGVRYIQNVPGRGYCFIASVAQDLQPKAATASVHTRWRSLPVPLARMIGRSEIVATLVAEVPTHRLVTVVGPGGIGKTTVAIAAAERLHDTYEDGVRFVDFAPLADPALVPSVLATTLGAASASADPIPNIIKFVESQSALLLFDNCEHVIEAVANLAERILAAAPRVHILTTSREPLRASGEWVHRLPSLEMPRAATASSAADALRFAAVQLFVERAVANRETFELTDANAATVIEICRRLDGIPLAIELAASMVDVLDLGDLAVRLDDRFAILTRGRRTALPRHRTLRATLDWSYDLLSERERTTLQRLSIFKGPFTFQAANAIADSGMQARADTFGIVADLAAKSLVTIDVSDAFEHCRLLESTRSYAYEKLQQSGELERVARAHAEYFRDLFQRIETSWTMLLSTEEVATRAAQIDNARAALDWAFSVTGDPAIGVSLAVATVPMWMHFALLDECRVRVRRALIAVEGGAAAHGGHEAMRLQLALGAALLQTQGWGPELTDTFRTANRIAERLGDPEYRLRTMWGLWIGPYMLGDYAASRSVAEQFLRVADELDSPVAVAVADRLMGASLHILGRHDDARVHLERMLQSYVRRVDRSDLIRFQFDQRVTARCFLGHILWLQGHHDRAARMARDNVADAESLNHVASLFYSLILGACSLDLLNGDAPSAERDVAQLQGLAITHAWSVWGRAYEGARLIDAGEIVRGCKVLDAALQAMPTNAFQFRYTQLLGQLALGMSLIGDASTALARVDQALRHSEKTGERWCLAELWRIRGEIALRQRGADANDYAQAQYRNAIDLARTQGALSWELRAATSLARLHYSRGLAGEARDILIPVLGQFAEGLASRDMVDARTLLEELRT